MSTCPSWCIRQEVDCGDHLTYPGSEAWPAVRATAWAENGVPSLVAHPTWGEVDGLAPAVSLWLQGDDHLELDECIDMTPDEAEALARRLLAAVEAVKAG